MPLPPTSSYSCLNEFQGPGKLWNDAKRHIVKGIPEGLRRLPGVIEEEICFITSIVTETAHEALADFHPPSGDTARASIWTQRAMDLYTRYQQTGSIGDLDEAIGLGREALSLFPPGHSERWYSLNNLAIYLSARYKQLRQIDELNEAIVLNQEALSLRPLGHLDHSMSLKNLASCLYDRYKQLGGNDNLSDAIALDRVALSSCPSGYSDRTAFLNNLAGHLSSRYERLGEIDDLEEALVLHREALLLCPPGHPDRSMFLNNLGNHLWLRYEQFGITDALSEAIILIQESLLLCPSGHPKRSVYLNNLANCLYSRCNQLGSVDDLDEAIFLNRESLSLCSPGSSDRSMSLNNLAICLTFRYDLLGKIGDLEEAITLHREALSLCQPGHPDRFASLHNLAHDLSSRYEQLRGIDDINEAIFLDREAHSLCTPGHPQRSKVLNNLANDLSSRYRQLGETHDLNEAIVLSREALSLCPPGHPDCSMCLNNLANHLSSWHEQFRVIDDLNEAIVLSQDALSLCPPGHPDHSMSLNNLANHLHSRYELLGEIGDLNEAIVLGQEVLSFRPPGHPDRSISLRNLGIRLSSRYKHLRGINDLNGATDDKQALLALYAEVEHVAQMVSTHDLFAARAWVDTAEEFHHHTTLSAYKTALRLLAEHSAALPPLPQHLAVLKSLSSSLAADAFSACLRNQSLDNAVELLEQGRGVFWTQLTRLRSPLEDVIAPGPEGKVLADEFTRLTSLVRMVLNSPGPDQHEQVWGLNLRLKNVVSDIRALPGLSRFLLPSLFSDLRRAASDGPVIIVNASKYGCDALVVFVDKDPIHIPLPVTKEHIRGLSSNLHTLRKLAKQKRMDVTTGFRSFLRELWDRVVSHIVDVLRATCPRQSRIWWCPTADFSLLPLHAATPYRKGQESVSDLFISSYTTTLTALIRATRPDIPKSELDKERFIAIGQAQAPGLPRLHSIHTELTNIKRHVKTVATLTRVEGRDAHTSGITDKLSKNEWVHFACHGVLNQGQPFESGFALYDGLFTIQQIIQCNLENPEFAYLSACRTTVGDQENPDEVIHLASAMQFSGFRSVIGTMWSVADSPATKVASTFYKLMVDETGRLDYTRAAWALWKTLRTVDIPVDEGILYIHLGA